MYFLKQTLRRYANLRPTKRDDIKDRGPAMPTRRTCEVELYIGLGITFNHLGRYCSKYCLRQCFRSHVMTILVSLQHTAPDQLLTSSSYIPTATNRSQVQAIRKAKMQFDSFGSHLLHLVGELTLLGDPHIS